MSNNVNLVSTTFINNMCNGETYGFRMYDEYESVYCNLFEQPFKGSNKQLLELVVKEYSDVVSEMLEFVCEFEVGITINDVFYDFNEIREYLE